MQSNVFVNLGRLSDVELESDLKDLCGKSRAITAQIIEYLREVDSRRLYLKKGFSSLFAFCTQGLGMSESEANTRVSVSRLVTKAPSLLKALETGEVNLTTGFLLRNHLNKENCNDLLQAVAGKSTRDVEKVIAAKFPQPDAPAFIRKLPAAQPEPELKPESEITFPKTSAAERTISMFADVAPPASPPPTAPTKPLKPFSPLSEERHKIQFTASTELREKIERALRLSSHRNRTGDLAAMVEEAVDLFLSALEKERLGKTTRTRTSSTRSQAPESERNVSSTKPVPSRRFSRETRREVFKRDGEQCAFVADDGTRCSEKRFLELDHIEARARGGANTSENARVLCAAHNRYAAEQVFGRQYVDRRIHLARQRKNHTASPSPVETEAHSHARTP